MPPPLVVRPETAGVRTGANREELRAQAWAEPRVGGAAVQSNPRNTVTVTTAPPSQAADDDDDVSAILEDYIQALRDPNTGIQTRTMIINKVLVPSVFAGRDAVLWFALPPRTWETLNLFWFPFTPVWVL